MASFQARPHGQARSDVTYPCSRPGEALHVLAETRFVVLAAEPPDGFSRLVHPVPRQDRGASNGKSGVVNVLVSHPSTIGQPTKSRTMGIARWLFHRQIVAGRPAERQCLAFLAWMTI